MQQPYSILDLIPQRPPMVMVDHFVGMDDEGSYTTFEVKEPNFFVEQGRMTECGLIEHMAQSAAARVGYLARMRGEEVQLGFIGSVNNLQVVSLPAVGEQLQTTIRVLQEVFQVTLVEAETWVGRQIVATCRMKIVLKG